LFFLSASFPSTPGKPAPGKRTPYQFLKIKGAKIQEKVIRVPSIDNNRPFEKTRTKNKKKPNANGDMSINIQLMNQVDTNGNEKGILAL
jgi:hypothetical protein